ncbi:tape measure protein [Aeromonas phage vB_AveS_KLEA5]|nr:tape measure protein [Aeromonas phage vB_AveS_KLEA5]
MSDVLRSTTFQLEFKGQDGITGIKQFTRAVSDADKTVEELSATLGDNVEVTYKNVQSKQELTAEARALVSQMERTNARVKEMTSLYQHQASMIGKTAQEQEVLNAVYKLGASATQEQKQQVTQLVQNYQTLRDGSNQTEGSFRNLRGVSQQLGWQLQDVAVQAQLGTSAFVIFSQQGSQLAAAFGPTGALVGAVIAVAGAIGGALVNSMGVAGEEIDKLIGKVDSLGKATKELAAIELRKKIQDDQRRLVEIDSLSRIGFLQDKQRDGISLTMREHKELLKLQSEREQLSDAIVTQEGYLDTLTRSMDTNIETEKKSREATQKLLTSYGLKIDLLGKTDREQAKVNARAELGSAATEDQIAAVMAGIDVYYNEYDALKAREKAIKDAEKAEKDSAAESRRISQQRERAFQAETLSLIKQTETTQEEYDRRKKIIDEYVKYEGTNQRTDEAYAALEQWRTQKLAEEYKKREAVRKQIEEAQRKQGGRDDPTGFENDTYARNLQLLTDQKKALGESELTERQRIDSLIEAETERHVARLNEISNTQLEGQLQNYATFTGSMGKVFGQLQQFAEEGSKEAAALFYINQAIALAETIVNTELAATKAMGQLGVFGIPASTLIRATGYASAGIIAGQTIAGAYDKGGNIPSGQLGIVSEYGDELVNGVLVEGPARVTSREDTAKMMNGGGGSVSIVIENRIDGASYREERIDENTVRIIAERVFNDNIDSGVSSVLGNRNSRSTKQMKNSFNVKGKV